MQDIPPLQTTGLRECQVVAINNLEKSFRANHPRALIQMATGSGKTYTAITAIYRLLKYAKAGRVLFLVDTKNPVSYTHLRAHETVLDLVCRLLLEKKKQQNT